MINGDNEGLMVQENVRIPEQVEFDFHFQILIGLFCHNLIVR